MNTKQKRELYRRTITAINEGHLIPAFRGVRELAAISGPGIDLTGVDQEEEIYHQMVRYFILNAPDPKRDELKDGIRKKLLHLADTLYARSLSDSTHNYFYINRKKYEKSAILTKGELAGLDNLSHGLREGDPDALEQRLERAFFEVWMVNDPGYPGLQHLREYLCSEEPDGLTGAVLTSALVLSLLEKFNPVVWMLLADIYETRHHQLWQRAFLGMLLAIIRFDHRLNLYPEVGRRFSLLAEHGHFADDFERVAVQLVRTGDTEKVTRRLQEEIIPEMMKLAPKIQEKLSLDQFLQDETGEEKNPEWEEFFQDSPEIYKKIEELNQLQSEGVDLFITAFSRLKHFPFFQATVNWFLPYAPQHPALKTHHEDQEEPSTDLEEFFEVFASFPVMCNSDKYSFSLNLIEMPEEQKRMIMNALSGEMREMNKVSDDEAMISSSEGYEVFHQYAQDLYRFFRIHPAHEETEDPFAMRRQLYQCQVVRGILEEMPGLSRRLAEYYFQQGHYTHAITIYEMLAKAPQESPELFQKLAYAWQMEGDLDKALSYYRKAELFDSNVLWNLRKIAWCHHLKGEPAEALKAYREAELLAPDSVQIKLNIGNLLLGQNDWEEALHYYLKAEELNPGNEKTLRPVAWCLFLLGELETASYYYEQIMELRFNHNDLLNFGHVKFALKELEAALALYRQSYTHRKQNHDTFTESYNNDKPHLLRLGLTSQEVAFMVDAVMGEG
jgi:tetratricopeptide (TPR) repeat protein